MEKFIFNLTSPFHLAAADEVLAICEGVIFGAGDNVPEKFLIANVGLNKMLEMKPVTKEEYVNIGDVIGGYFLSIHKLAEIEKVDPDRLLHAKELMRFWQDIDRVVTPSWGLSVVRDEE